MMAAPPVELVISLPPLFLFTRGAGEMGITKDQQTKITQIYQKYAEKSKPLSNSVWKASEALRLALLSKKTDKAKISALVAACVKAETTTIQNQVQSWQALSSTSPRSSSPS